jgi:uncharacterized glyoxalase superfamily protein PhnB
MAEPYPSITPALSYQDPRKALDFLQRAFGFEIAMLIEDEKGNVAHSQMSFGNGMIMVGSEWNEDTKSPASIGRKCTQTVHIHLTDDVDQHCATARAAGAEILQEPDTQFYGDRTYRARDPEGHIWTFGQTVKVMTPEEWDKESGGLRTTTRK